MANIAKKNGVTNLDAKYLGLEDVREANDVYSPQRVPSADLNMSFDPANAETFQIFSTNYHDLQGNVTGQVNGSPTYSSKGYFDFDASNDYIDIENTTSVRTETYSEVYWVKPQMFGNSYPPVNVTHTLSDGKDYNSSGTGAGGGRMSLRWLGASSGGFIWRFRTTTGSAFNTGITESTHGSQYFDHTKWYMLVVVVTSNTSGQINQVDLYLNDNTDNMNHVNSVTGAGTYTTPKTESHWHLGANNGGTSQFAEVQLGETHQYNKALSSTEITDIWNKTKARYGY